LEINGFEPADKYFVCCGRATKWLKRVVCGDEKVIVVKIQTAKILSSVKLFIERASVP